MIELENVAVTFHAAGHGHPVLEGVDLGIPEGEFALVIGATGSGKSTLLQTIAGTLPAPAAVTGRVRIAGHEVGDQPGRAVGFLGQNPSFATGTVEDELAGVVRSHGLGGAVVRQRVEGMLDLLGLAALRHRPLGALSGGERQRVAIGALLTGRPSVLVLDEPTSALDPLAAEEVLAVLQRLVHDLGLTIVLAEHRLERVAQYADQVILLPGHGEPIRSGAPAEVFADSPVAPPVAELGRVAGWHPLPLSVRDARRHAPGLLARLDAAPATEQASPIGAAVCRAADVVVSYDRVPVLRRVSTVLARSEIVALMGRNGAGKSTLLATLAATLRPDSGTVTTYGVRTGLVPQALAEPGPTGSVERACQLADTDAGLPVGSTRGLLQELWPDVALQQDPRHLSAGGRLTLALALVLATRPGLILLDEPTRGLDYSAKHRLARVLRDLARAGHSVVLATHDVELVADVATRVMVLADGEIVADGPTADVVVSSPAFAPQVAKVLAPQRWLTPAQVAAALAR